MRKFTFAAFLLSLISISAVAQNYSIGIKIAPTLTYSKLSTDGTKTNYDDDRSTVNFLIGAFVDYEFKENYFFSAGLNYASKDFGITARSTNSIANVTGVASFNQEFLQVPALLKLFTNEVILDTKVYFNFGFVPEIRLSNSPESTNSDMVREFRSFDIAGNFGGGLERTMGVNTRIYAGIFYNLGLVNQVKEQNNTFDELSLKNRLFALEVGIKF
ncbi:outer membrane beta-barrel protein [Roseivirga echinicomitans]